MSDFAQNILTWYKDHGRDLPWREIGIDPYKVVVSEFMLQQTQVTRVVEKYKEFLKLFPTLQDLANANKADVIKSWSGLGYNRRAINLQEFAQKVVFLYDGKIPSVPEALIKLPGIGPYMAGSISTFAFNRPEPAVDVNVRRIYMRFFKGEDQGAPMDSFKENRLKELVKSSIPQNRSSDLHNALMDFANLVCTRSNPKCPNCPLKSSCQFFPKYKENSAEVMFVKEKKIEKGMEENGKHIPNRIYRGRIVEFVRNNEGKEFSLFSFGRKIKADYITSQQGWLLTLCKKLEKEGMIDFETTEKTITLKIQN